MKQKIDFKKLVKLVEKLLDEDAGSNPTDFIKAFKNNEKIESVVNDAIKVSSVIGQENVIGLLFLMGVEIGITASTEDIYEEKELVLN